jgi:YHS domain-containing protein
VRKADREGRKSVHGGKTFYFSSMACKQQFDSDPARYAGAGEEKQDVSAGGSAR